MRKLWWARPDLNAEPFSFLFFLHKNAFAFLAIHEKFTFRDAGTKVPCTPKSFAFCAFRLSVSFFFHSLFTKRKKGLPATTRLSAGYSDLAKLPAHFYLICNKLYKNDLFPPNYNLNRLKFKRKNKVK